MSKGEKLADEENKHFVMARLSRRRNAYIEKMQLRDVRAH